ncbi:hypothetical protein L6164_016691 [Bauhinia variegata]|uniref:Uncharacterized protein n=1 Tax=Bauhinia variegata TaxID=167791 RepID=A0ACB9NPF4_BAUVA|nr:hypothetical protein L6164_016691 [Bauhinia variegata]
MAVNIVDHLMNTASSMAFVHVPKDERSKLDAKTRQCVFIGYGHDDFGHRFYDPVEKKLVRSRDAIFMEDQSIKDIDKAEKSKSSSVGGLVDLDPTPTPVSVIPDVVEHDNNGEHVQDVQVENNGGDNIVVDAPTHRAVDEPTVRLRRSVRHKISSTHYSSDDYILLTDGGELESYEEVMEIEDKAIWIATMNDEMKSLYDNHTFELVKLPEASLDLEVEHMDVKTAFLHGDLEENIYMKQPKCFVVTGHDSSIINLLKKELSKSFAMKELGLERQILGMEIIRDRKNKKLWLSQEKYIEKVLQQFHMNKAKAHIPYRPAVGSLMYAMVCTRPDIAHAVGVVSRFLSNPGREHWNAVKWIMRYLRGTSSLKLCFGIGELVLHGYIDSDLAGDVDTRKSTSGYLVTFARGAVAWQSKLQKCVALSSTKAEFIATTEACKELLWMKKFMYEHGFTQKRYILYFDSQSVIYLCKNPTFHGRSKYINVKYHWIRDVLDSKSLELVKIHTNDNCSDMLTKILPRGKFEACCVGAGLAHTPA